VRVRVFGSGSDGNALVVRSAGGALLLVDCGFSYRELNRRAAACGVEIGTAAGLLFTHDHIDHFSGLGTFHKKCPAVPLFANGETCDAIAAKTGVADGWQVFETAEPFDVADFTVTPFSLSHDAADPVGYLISDGAATLFVGTDTGVVTTGFRNAFSQATCAVLESNYDPRLLEGSNRPLSLKQRIAGRSGHLANADAAELMRAVNPPRLKTLLLGHLSRECNAPWLAREAMEETLRELGRTDVHLETLAQDEPSDCYVFGERGCVA